jgi:hypothetical protein
MRSRLNSKQIPTSKTNAENSSKAKLLTSASLEDQKPQQQQNQGLLKAGKQERGETKRGGNKAPKGIYKHDDTKNQNKNNREEHRHVPPQGRMSGARVAVVDGGVACR